MLFNLSTLAYLKVCFAIDALRCAEGRCSASGLGLYMVYLKVCFAIDALRCAENRRSGCDTLRCAEGRCSAGGFEKRAELIAVDSHAALAAVFLDAAGDHLDRHADLDGLLVQISELGSDGGAFGQSASMDLNSYTRPGMQGMMRGGFSHDQIRRNPQTAMQAADHFQRQPAFTIQYFRNALLAAQVSD